MTLIMALGMNQNVMAKTITYLGHEYSGKVNDRNMPEGKGKITIGELIIKGDFSDKTISNASFETQWLKYNGVVEYSRENEIILKRGGIFTKYYYNARDIERTGVKNQLYDYSLAGKLKSKEEPLSQDVKTDYERLKKEPFRLNYSFKAEGIPSELDPPELFNSMVEYSLEEYNVRNMGYQFVKNIFAYVIDTESNNVTEIKKYKDEKNRIWDYKKDWQQNVSFLVTYPDSSQYASDGSWTLKYPGGQKVFHFSKSPKKLQLNKELLIKIHGFYEDIEVAEFVSHQSEKKKIILPSGVDMFLFDEKENLGASELEQYLKTEVLSVFQIPNSFEANIFNSNKVNIGKYSNGKFIPVGK